MHRRLRQVLVAGLVLIVATPLGVWGGSACVVRRAEPYLYASAADVPHRPYAIVLGAAVHGDAPSDALADRLAIARDLFAAQRVDRIYVSGDGVAGEDRVMATWLVAHGIPADRVTRDPLGFRTRTTMENASAAGIAGAIVCTQDFHLARSVLWARELGIDAVGLEADYRIYTPHLRDSLREAIARTVALGEIWRR